MRGDPIVSSKRSRAAPMGGRHASVRRAGLPLWLWAVGLAACTTTGPQRLKPHEVLRAYARAVAERKYDAAYGLLSAGFRKRHSRAAFEKMLREDPERVERVVARLAKAERLKITAELALSRGDALRLVLEDGKWRIGQDPLDFYDQSTPKAALRSFVRAIERRRYDIVMRFVPAKWASSMTKEQLRKQWEGEKRAEIEGLLEKLKANLDAPIQIDGAEASMPYGEHEVKFVREDGAWKIADPD